MLDQNLYFASLSAYIVGALALTIYFLNPQKLALRIGVTAAIVGSLAQFADLAVRFATTHIWPLTNLYGSLSLFSAMSVTLFLIFAARYRMWFLGGIVQYLAAGFLAYASTWNEGSMPAVPALQSYWIKIHVPLVVSSYAAFMVAACISAMYLLKYAFEKSLAKNGAPLEVVAPNIMDSGMRISTGTPYIERAAEAGDRTALWLNTLPGLPELDIMTYRVAAVGLPLLTVGIITGAWWAKEAWGAYWQWDPKETAALLSWIIYASYMHLHTRHAWRGARSAWISLLGFASILFCYLGVNIWISGLHSYKF
jgi:cytochrome c-type biogenesis protein CcsB